MADSQSCSRMLNPWVLHLKKLGLELKCPSCLELFNKPNLLPCDHLFCGSCLPDSNSASGSECAICKRPFHMKDVRQASFMENIVNIYRSLDMTFSSCMHQVAYVKPTTGSLSPLPSSQTKLKQNGHDDAIDLNDNQPIQLSQGSPPFGVNSSGPGSSNDSLERLTVKKSNKRLADEFTSNKVHCSTNPLADNSMKAIKKPKQNINGEGDVCDIVSDTQTIHVDSPVFVCGFCQTSKVTEHTGQMMHYSGDGKPVAGQEATKPDIIHVHSKCTEWTPQVYYIDENVKNLNKELQRGAKLKCFKCNLKGAALGCYAKSCKRTYHVPCAVEISKCRWDTDKYLLLCPIHASFKFPSEKSKKLSVKPDVPAQKELNYYSFWSTSHTGAKNWIFCPSSLSNYEKHIVTDFAGICGATVSKCFSPTVTHVIAGIDETGAYTRTRKVLMAILEGKWVVSIDWIEECLKMRAPVDEEPYEISLDTQGSRDGPKTGRLRVDGSAPKLFKDLKFYFTGESTFVSAHLEDLKSLIRAAGGIVVESKTMVQDSGTCMIVYNCDSDTDTESDSGALQSQLEAEVLAVETGSTAIPHTCILNAIASCNLMPLF